LDLFKNIKPVESAIIRPCFSVTFTSTAGNHIMNTDNKSFIIVSGGDANYFPLLADLAASIRRLPEGKNVALGMLDGGLTQEQVTALESEDVKVVKPDWPVSKDELRVRGREYLRINLNKPALDLLFPEYSIIIWLDGDTWVQTWDAIPMFVHVANKGKLAIVSRATRLQTSHIRMRKRLFGWVEPRGVLFKNAKRARLPSRLVWSLVNRPVLNAGAYALRQDAPHWGRWRSWQKVCLQHGRPFSSDQLSLALSIYEDGLPYEALPEICNYMGPWRIDQNKGMLVDYFAPYNPISIVHLIGKDSARVMAGQPRRGIDQDDNPVDLFLGYRALLSRPE
jgi:hypothetical protein